MEKVHVYEVAMTGDSQLCMVAKCDWVAAI
jgi:hypothetical protein